MERFLKTIFRKKHLVSILAVTAVILIVVSCKHEPYKQSPMPVELKDNYPPEIRNIIVNKCATAGCHNKESYQLSGGNLLLDSWEHMLNGGNSGAVVIAYSPENSALLYFTNSFSDLGALPPDNMKMPLNGDSLTREEYLTLFKWIKNGAPDNNGNIAFASNPDTRQKIYLAHQGCDYVTVIDAEKHVVMRMIPVGKEVVIESAHSLKISPDGSTGYLCFWGNQYLQKIDTRRDTISGIVDLTAPNSNMLLFSNNGQSLFLTNWFYGRLLKLNAATGQVESTFGNFSAPHGIATNLTNDTFFVTEQYGNMVYKISASGSFSKVSVNSDPPVVQGSNMPGVHNITMVPNRSRYFVTCEESNEVRVLDAYTNQLLQVLPVGTRPQEMVISKTHPYIFVACVEDNNTNNLYKGSVYVINYNTYEIVDKVSNRYYLPHALALDDLNGKLFVFSRNIDSNGPVPHHGSSSCGGRSGYYSVYDVNTLSPLNNRRYEVIVDPYSADIRFK